MKDSRKGGRWWGWSRHPIWRGNGWRNSRSGEHLEHLLQQADHGGEDRLRLGWKGCWKHPSKTRKVLSCRGWWERERTRCHHLAVGARRARGGVGA